MIVANRSVRKNLGFTHTTESMLSLATSALQTLLEERGPVKAIVLGFGDMGMKAVEALLDANQTNIAVVSRNPERSAERNPSLAAACTMLSYEQWGNGDHEADLVMLHHSKCKTHVQRRPPAPLFPPPPPSWIFHGLPLLTFLAWLTSTPCLGWITGSKSLEMSDKNGITMPSSTKASR